MTKELTERYKKGELSGGYYYLDVKGLSYIISRSNVSFLINPFTGKCFEKEEVIEVYDKVPSYEEYKKLKERLSIALETLGQIAMFSSDKADAVHCAKAIKEINEVEDGN